MTSVPSTQPHHHMASATSDTATSTAVATALAHKMFEATAKLWDNALEKACAAGLLQPFASKPGNSAFEHAWMQLVTHGWHHINDLHRAWISNTLTSLTLASQIDSLLDAPDFEAAVQALQTRCHAGTLDRVHHHHECLINAANGEHLALGITNWTPRVWRHKRDDLYVAPSPMPHGLAFQQRLEVPSGQLLVADCISIGGLWDAVRDKNRAQGIDISTAWGRIMSTRTGLSALGYANLHGSQDDTQVLAGADTSTLFGAALTDLPPVASLEHSYWGTSFIDRQTAHRFLVDEGMDSDEADTAIDVWLDQSPHHTLLTVPAGTWSVLWDEDGVSVQAALQAANIPHPQGVSFALLHNAPTLPSGTVLDFG